VGDERVGRRREARDQIRCYGYKLGECVSGIVYEVVNPVKL